MMHVVAATTMMIRQSRAVMVQSAMASRTNSDTSSMRTTT
ncbi:MAG: hypothetical protein QOI89_3892, partial [Solirubrobacteraceae bacterium]|nr:hypothetical protein [Solirubrobacteraceae bacterium]